MSMAPSLVFCRVTVTPQGVQKIATTQYEDVGIIRMVGEDLRQAEIGWKDTLHGMLVLIVD